MSAYRKYVGVAAMGLLLAASGRAWADDEAALAKAPAAVQAAAKKIVGDNKLAGFDTETADGKKVYEVSLETKGGGDYSVTLNEAGDVVEREVEVDAAIVPPDVLDAAQQTHADGKITESSIVTADGKMFYEFDLKVGKDVHEVRVNAKGNVLTDTVPPPEADEKDEGGEKK